MSAVPIHRRAGTVAKINLRSRVRPIAIAASPPQIQSSLAKLRGQVSQNGADREKLPSLNRKEFVRLCTIEAIASSVNAACGASRFHRGGSTMQNSGRRMTADSLESRARANRAVLSASRRYSQQSSEAIPKQ